jgi:tritrans,polycis-undecaprenyl-diphosphate synthase [geranylgeranyl-diphosphate specific]
MLQIPQHVGIIPDGNRRLARRLMKQPWKGHEWGVGKIRIVMDWAKELGVRVVTVYLLSLENIEKRPKRELKYIYDLTRKEVSDLIKNRNHPVHKNRTRVRFFGRLDLLPEDIQELIKTAMNKTKNYSDTFLNLAMAYGGRQEIVEAVKKIAADASEGRLKPEEINEAVLRANFWTNGFPDPDMIIRTGGEKRMSNFLPFQATYSELVFVEKLWPEFEKEDLIAAIEEYGQRQRRFGK